MCTLTPRASNGSRSAHSPQGPTLPAAGPVDAKEKHLSRPVTLYSSAAASRRPSTSSRMTAPTASPRSLPAGLLCISPRERVETSDDDLRAFLVDAVPRGMGIVIFSHAFLIGQAGSGKEGSPPGREHEAV